MSVNVTRIFADSAGETHFGEAELPSVEAWIRDQVLAGFVNNLPILSMEVVQFTREAETPGWSPTPVRRFVLHLEGNSEIEVSDGQRRRFGPGDILFLEDVTGKGHRIGKPGGTNRIMVNLNVQKDWRFPTG